MNEAERHIVARTSLAARVFGRPLARLSLAWLVLVAVGSFGARWLAPDPPLAISLNHLLAGPTWEHPLGTDSLGRDVLTRLMYGGSQIFLDVLLVWAVVLVLAVPLAITLGLVRGKPDALASRVADLVLSVPGIMILLMVLAFFQHSLVAAMITLGVLSSPALFRIIRASTIAVSEEPYIAAARVSGRSQWQIATRHVLPRISGTFLVQLSLLAAGAVMAEAALSFLGVGKPPPAPSWGLLVADASTTMFQQPWLLVPTGGVLMLTVLSLVLLGDAIRDATGEAWTGVSAGSTAAAQRQKKVAAPDVGRIPDDLSLPSLRPRDAVLQLDNVTIAFPAEHTEASWQPVVEGVTFGISRGESVGLVGESGCGKTMTALAILGLLPAAGQLIGGDIVVNGRAVSGMRRRERRALRGSKIAFISQEPMAALDPLFTIGSQLSEAVRVHAGCRHSSARKRAVQLLRLVQLDDPEQVARLRPFEISGGMAQRVSIAVALAGNPELLIADEPTTALDVTVQAEIIELLRVVQRETGMALLLISHDWEVVAKLCDRAIVMYTGQVVEQGETAAVIAGPLHPYSQGLLSASPKLVAPGSVLQTIPGTVLPPSEWPASCHFADRCKYATAECSTGPIALTEPQQGRLARCIHSSLVQRDFTKGSHTHAATASETRVASLVPSPALLELRSLTVAFPRPAGRPPLRAVDGVNLEVAAGETVGLVGESGSGKSTIGRAVLGLAPINGGQIFFQGRDITNLRFKERRPLTALLQVVFQDPYGSLNPALPIRRTLAEPLEVHQHVGRSEVTARVSQMMEMVGLPARAAERYPRDFSGGQRQRIAIARALMTSPELIICDEPVSSLDLSVQAQILNLLVDLQRSIGVGYLFISHDLAVVRHIAQKVFVIYRGQIMEAGDTETLYGSPAHPYTRSLLAASLTLRASQPKIEAPAGESYAGSSSGCPYRMRCPFASNICATTRPELKLTATGALSACHHTDRVLEVERDHTASPPRSVVAGSAPHVSG